MRWFICAVVVLAFAPSAYAADLDILRGTDTVGPATFTNWSGFYFGGQFGYSSASANFTKSTQPLVATSLAELTLESRGRPVRMAGAWLGQRPHVRFRRICRLQYAMAGFDPRSRRQLHALTRYHHRQQFADPRTGSSWLGSNDGFRSIFKATGSMEITDYGSLRARAGWVLGNFLPYGFAGVALGWGNYSVTSLIYGQQNALTATPPIFPCNPGVEATCVDYDFSNSAARQGVLLYGFSVGGGLDRGAHITIFSCGPNTSTCSLRRCEYYRLDVQRPCRRRLQILTTNAPHGQPIGRRHLTSQSCIRLDGTAVAFPISRRRDTPPHRGATIWKDRS